VIGEEPTPPPPTKYQIFEDENMRTGAKWGFGIGCAVALLVMSGNSGPGFYTGSVTLLYLVCIGGGLLAGLTWGWNDSRRKRESGEFPPDA
jgi:hypothetical protein